MNKAIGSSDDKITNFDKRNIYQGGIRNTIKFRLEYTYYGNAGK